MRVVAISLIILILSGCNQAGAIDNENRSVEIGRYVYVTPTDRYPAMVLDTATGCVEALTSAPKLPKGTEDLEYLTIGNVQKVQIDFGPLGKDRACSASGITPSVSEAQK